MAVKLDTTKLDAILVRMPGKRSEIIRTAAFEVEGDAKRRAPEDTRALINSIQAEEKDETTWRVGDGVEYGIYQEMGTSRMAAQPFLIPAVEAVRQMFVNKWKELFQ